MTDDIIRKYSSVAVIEHWLFFLLGIGLVLTAVPSFINSFLIELHIFDVSVPTPFDSSSTHKMLGSILIIVSLFHVFYHSLKSDRQILSESPFRDFKEFLHSLLFMIGFARKETYLADEKFNSIHKVTYISLVYCGGLSLATGIILVLDSPASNAKYLENGILLTHVITSIMIFFIVLYHIIINLRKKNWIGMKAIFLNKEIPGWYIKRHHRNWYDDLVNEGKIEAITLGNQLRLDYDGEQQQEGL